MNKILVFGASGQLGQCLKVVAERKGIADVVSPSEEIANILNMDNLKQLFAAEKPSYIINCAAYTAVDKAEDDIDNARKINKDGAVNLAHFCKKHNTTYIHVSTDFVFKGDKSSPLVENDLAEPINVYGLTKLEGELAIAAVLEQHFILRTSWLYSEFANNFVKTMLRLGATMPEIKIIADQVGTPTYAIDLANCIFEIIQQNSTAYGTYHFSNEGVTSWYDFAHAIFDISQTNIKVLPINTSEYPTKAVRPAYSVMDKSKIKSALNIQIPHWRESLVRCINEIKAQN